MKPWMWLAIGGAALYFWSKRSTFVQLPQRPPEPEIDPLAFETMAGYDDPGKRLAEQLWGYSVSPSSKNFGYKGSH